MPREKREIVFDREELEEALQELRHYDEGLLPEGRIEPIEFHESGLEIELEVEVSPSEGPQPARIRLNGSEVAVALLFLCEKLGIPLAREAEKVLRVRDGEAALVMTLES